VAPCHAHEVGRMRQGEIGKGAWIGDPLGGERAPEVLILPDTATRFTRTAARLEELSAEHPMMEWLRFMAQLARAQHVAATTAAPLAGPTHTEVERAIEAGWARHAPNPLLLPTAQLGAKGR
jgi:FdhE protein